MKSPMPKVPRPNIRGGSIRTLALLIYTIPALISMPGSPAEASENGAALYPTGTNTVEPAMMPPPGEALWLNYVTYYTADSFNNSSGNSAVPGYLVNAEAEAA